MEPRGGRRAPTRCTRSPRWSAASCAKPTCWPPTTTTVSMVLLDADLQNSQRGHRAGDVAARALPVHRRPSRSKSARPAVRPHGADIDTLRRAAAETREPAAPGASRPEPPRRNERCAYEDDVTLTVLSLLALLGRHRPRRPTRRPARRSTPSRPTGRGRRQPATTTASPPATSCASRSTRTRSCRSRCRSGPTARSRCRSSATSPPPDAPPIELRDAHRRRARRTTSPTRSSRSSSPRRRRRRSRWST